MRPNSKKEVSNHFRSIQSKNIWITVIWTIVWISSQLSLFWHKCLFFDTCLFFETQMSLFWYNVAFLKRKCLYFDTMSLFWNVNVSFLKHKCLFFMHLSLFWNTYLSLFWHTNLVRFMPEITFFFSLNWNRIETLIWTI